MKMLFFSVCLVFLTFSCTSTKHAIIFDGNGAESGLAPVISNLIIKENYLIVPANIGNLEKRGFNFVGWNFIKNGLETRVIPGDKVELVNSPMKFHASWDGPKEILITKVFGTLSGYTYFKSITTDHLGNIIIAGFFTNKMSCRNEFEQKCSIG